MNNVEEYYNCQYDEWGRLTRHRIDYKISDSKVIWGSCEHLLYVGKKIDKGGGWKE